MRNEERREIVGRLAEEADERMVEACLGASLLCYRGGRYCR